MGYRTPEEYRRGWETEQALLQEESTEKLANGMAQGLGLDSAKEQFPGAAPLLQKIYLSDDIAQDQSISEKVVANRLEKYERAIDGINSQNFPAEPSDDDCPHCQHFFNCPSSNQKKSRIF